jgi:hypothetical protein
MGVLTSATNEVVGRDICAKNPPAHLDCVAIFKDLREGGFDQIAQDFLLAIVVAAEKDFSLDVHRHLFHEVPAPAETTRVVQRFHISVVDK